ncbi:hypothetical protein [Facklamia sp. 7083-14-GEN3]|uniref:hypothetical protein n=1 Tax=Facklamia sp. 7083-14-GEN3 TaxID=2973478 RepID=UPI00215CCEDE|nr:hypothetical protein [Facklamia sp. 7083-14-GEN3]MCR8968638.1 hypothetical protein [Facklamia sp. 7083-14-GEN3]
MNKSKFQKMYLLLTLLGLCFIFNFDSITKVNGQEETTEEQTEIDQADETSSQESLEISTETRFEPLPDVSQFKQLIPYARYLNYQYVGDGSEYSTKDVIMEFMPDANGVFQVAEFTDTEAVAYVYQIRPEGLYELAYFDNYTVVEDLRYSADASDDNVSLILPVDISEGTIFKSGYQEETKKKIIGRVDSLTIGQDNYTDVLLVEEMEKNNGDTIRIYYANDAGLTLIERLHPDGTTTPIIYLKSRQGSIMDQ